MKLNEFPIIRKRYVQLLRAIQCIHGVFTLLLLYQALSYDDPLKVLNAGLLSNLGMVTVIQLLIVQLKKGRVALVVSIHQLITFSFLIMQELMFGGVSTPNTAAFHLPLLIISIYTRQSYYMIFFSMVLLVVIGLGLNDAFHFIVIEGSDVGEPDRVVSLILVYLYTGALSWVLIRDLKFAYSEKVKERERIEKAKDQIQQLADTDQLTGLLNRYGAYNKFETLLLDTDFSKSSIVLLFVDVDDFKSINDQYGHHVGDDVLTLVGQRLRNVAGTGALISRLGGDEFVIVLEYDNALKIDVFLDSVLAEVSHPFTVEGVAIETTSSIGVAVADRSGHTFDELCRKADMAMYQAKDDGKNHYYHYHDLLEQAYMANIKLLKGLQVAVDRGGLTLQYQPKFDTTTSQIMGAEALLHWEANNSVTYTGKQIIPVIETTNLIHDIGYWVLRKACQDCKLWHESGVNLPISVNISPRQLTDGEFAENVDKILQETGLPASSLILEIAEDALNQEGFDIIAQLQKVKKSGVKLSIDRFGVGHSNLAYLVDLNVDELKIDSGFIQKITSNTKAQSIVTAFVEMAKSMGIQLVAMEVEREEDHRTLDGLGCVIEQGFLWHKPVSFEDFDLIFIRQIDEPQLGY